MFVLSIVVCQFSILTTKNNNSTFKYKNDLLNFNRFFPTELCLISKYHGFPFLCGLPETYALNPRRVINRKPLRSLLSSVELPAVTK